MDYKPADLRSIVAGEVRAHLARRNLTANQTAAELGWTQPYLWRRLAGKVAFDVADLQAIANFLEVPVTEFFQVAQPDVRRPGSCPPGTELGAAA